MPELINAKFTPDGLEITYRFGPEEATRPKRPETSLTLPELEAIETRLKLSREVHTGLGLAPGLVDLMLRQVQREIFLRQPEKERS